ncbi:MAG TPA: hypothetical protein VFU43_14930 [Streptosporangiaceae bacterium]|nr:hypothetical protein [Streptosporangiaceae bacterium]
MGRQRRTTPPLVPEWDDPVLTLLARRLRDAHRRVAGLPAVRRQRLTRQLLLITDLAKRDPRLALRRLEVFLADLDADPDSDSDVSQ